MVLIIYTTKFGRKGKKGDNIRKKGTYLFDFGFFILPAKTCTNESEDDGIITAILSNERNRIRTFQELEARATPLIKVAKIARESFIL